jgi:hypothetical protein
LETEYCHNNHCWIAFFISRTNINVKITGVNESNTTMDIIWCLCLWKVKVDMKCLLATNMNTHNTSVHTAGIIMFSHIVAIHVAFCLLPQVGNKTPEQVLVREFPMALANPMLFYGHFRGSCFLQCQRPGTWRVEVPLKCW